MTIPLSSVTLEGRDPMQRRPDRLARLPEQYFSTLLRSVADVARAEGEPLIDLSRGNPEVGLRGVGPLTATRRPSACPS